MHVINAEQHLQSLSLRIPHPDLCVSVLGAQRLECVGLRGRSCAGPGPRRLLLLLLLRSSLHHVPHPGVPLVPDAPASPNRPAVLHRDGRPDVEEVGTISLGGPTSPRNRGTGHRLLLVLLIVLSFINALPLKESSHLILLIPPHSLVGVQCYRN